MPTRITDPVAGNITNVPCPKCKAQSEITRMETAFADEAEKVHTSTTYRHQCLNPACQHEFVKTTIIGAGQQP